MQSFLNQEILQIRKLPFDLIVDKVLTLPQMCNYSREQLIFNKV